MTELQFASLLRGSLPTAILTRFFFFWQDNNDFIAHVENYIAETILENPFPKELPASVARTSGTEQ